MGEEQSSEVDELLKELGTGQKPRGRPPKPSAPSRLPLETKSMVDSLSAELGISNQDAIKILIGDKKSKPLLDRVKELESIGGSKSLAGMNSADLKDMAISLMWGSIVKSQMRNMNDGDDEMGGGVNLDKIIALNMLNQQSMQNMMAMAMMNKPQHNGEQDDKLQEMFERIAEQNAQNQQALVQALGIKKDQEIFAEGMKSQNELVSKNLLEAVNILKKNMDDHDAKLEAKIAEIDSSKGQTALDKLREAHAMVKDFDSMVMEIAKEKGLTPAETRNLEDINKTLDLNLKYELSKRVFGIIDNLGKPMAEKAGEAVAEQMFKKALNNATVPTK